MQTFAAGKTIALEKQLDNQHQVDDNKSELDKRENTSLEGFSRVASIAPSADLNKNVYYQGANRTELEKGLDLDDRQPV